VNEVHDILKYFAYSHLPERLQQISEPLCNVALWAADELDGPELLAGLRKLLEAKDCFVRAKVSQES
jgi:translation elongation factor EF-G